MNAYSVRDDLLVFKLSKGNPQKRSGSAATFPSCHQAQGLTPFCSRHFNSISQLTLIRASSVIGDSLVYSRQTLCAYIITLYV